MFTLTAMNGVSGVRKKHAWVNSMKSGVLNEQPALSNLSVC